MYSLSLTLEILFLPLLPLLWAPGNGLLWTVITQVPLSSGFQGIWLMGGIHCEWWWGEGGGSESQEERERERALGIYFSSFFSVRSHLATMMFLYSVPRLLGCPVLTA